ncbi:alkaline phosphatase, partial [Roseinatronobacter sp. HJB301]|nr:alkaline phosphatase [Roseinatronobacter sp. HJB301]MDD7973367.1 alkaline phosphatase [Roseinatronobacter sp. HJB301]
DSGLTYPALGDIYVKNAMIKAASEVVLLADSSKIGRVSFSSLGGLDRVNLLITDNDITQQHLTQFQHCGLKVLRAK